MSTDPGGLALPLAFDAEALAADVATLPHDAWQPHFNSGIDTGDWSVVALRTWSDTPLLAACPRLRAALATFACPLTSVRLVRVGAGARVLEHRDYKIGFDVGEIRLHVPIVSSTAVCFEVGKRPLRMAPGECWYVDVTRPHCVANDGAEPRVHLELDCVVDDWLRELIATATASAFERFAARVERDGALREALWAESDALAFPARVAALAGERGFPVAAERVQTEMDAARRRWLVYRNG